MKLSERNSPAVPAGLDGADYSRLAEEHYFFAAISRDPKTALELIERGDEYQNLAGLHSVVVRVDAEVSPNHEG
jgi:hypothetical protein